MLFPLLPPAPHSKMFVGLSASEKLNLPYSFPLCVLAKARHIMGAQEIFTVLHYRLHLK